MANAAKHRKRAAEFEQLKQIDRAIASYIRAIEESESEGEDVDVALLNKVGDLTLRQGRVADAVTYYERAVEHYASSGLFNNAIALCNKILRSAPGRSNVYFTLGRICAKKGMRGDATRNFLEYASRMQQDGRVDEGMRALAEVADIMPELTEIRHLVEEHAARVGITLPRRLTPSFVPAAADDPAVARRDDKSTELVFLDLGLSVHTTRNTPPLAPRIPTPAQSTRATVPRGTEGRTLEDRRRGAPARADAGSLGPVSLDPFLLFDPSRPGTYTPVDGLETVTPIKPPAEPPAEPAFVLEDEPIIEPVIEPAIQLVIEPVIELAIDPVIELAIDPVIEPVIEPAAEPLMAVDHVARIEGLESSDDFVGDTVSALDGLTSDESNADVEVRSDTPMTALTWLTPEGVIGTGDELTDLETHAEESDSSDLQVETLSELVSEDFERVADDLPAVTDSGVAAGTPPCTPSIPRALTPIEVSPIPELDAAIEAGAHTAAFEEAGLEVALRRPPYRLDPHDFILPGELPPLLVDDALIDVGMRPGGYAIDPSDGFNAQPAPPAFDDDQLIDDDAPLVTPSYVTAIADDAVVEDIGDADEVPVDRIAAPEAADRAPVAEEAPEVAADIHAEATLRAAIEADRAVRTTPSLPLAAVAAEANVVATSRWTEMRAAVARAPQDWALRRRLAEALLEVGEREGGLAELQVALSGFAQTDHLGTAAEIADELVHISPERIAYHQKRVELSVRLNDPQRLRVAYLDLADTLIRTGDDTRAHAVYARVLELDPWDERARAALGAAAPPPPTRPSDDEARVDLAEWLRDEPGTTRMRMREPVVSGDEQADFDALLRHFKEGIARSLGEEDYESHYDLGVAYKEMGLLDDAIAEFQKALRSRRHRLPAYEALGQCFVEQSRHAVAATVLTRALHEPGLGDEQRVGVLYLLAYSCEALQRRDEARSYYSRVYATDILFRDVAARLAALDLVAR